MKCPKCHFENPEDTHFCGRCAAPLHAAEDISGIPTQTLQMPIQELFTGTTFAHRYQVIEELGKGGMGKVYKVFDTEIHEKVALKLIAPQIADDQRTIERFRNELKLARKISHKNVCRMYDINSEQGTHYITMEYVTGEDLKSMIRMAGQLGIGGAVHIAKQICEGLAEAHRLGVIHRDLKPQNIMIDREGHARIMDFGIAHSLSAKGITTEGIMIGTPEYMSPEQAEGKQVGPSSDIYSLGVILYEMLTGTLPFEGDTPISLAMKHKSEAAPDPREINPQITEELSRVVHKCLEKNKDRRYQTAGELLSELIRIEKSMATIEWEFTRRLLKTTIQKKRALFVIIPVLLVVLAAFIAGYWLLTRSGKEESAPAVSNWENSIAVLPFRDFSSQKDQEYFCDGITDAIIDRLSQFGELKVISTTSVMRFKDANKDIKDIAKELNVANVAEGTVQKEDNRIRVRAQLISAETGFHLWSNTYNQELESVFVVQDDISKSIAEAMKVKLTPESLPSSAASQPKNLEAYEYYMKGMHFIKSKYVISFKEEDFRAGVDMFKKAVEVDPNFAPAYFGLVWAYEHHYQATQDKIDIELAQKNCEIAWRLDQNSALANAMMGYYYYEYKNKRDKAFLYFKKALEINPNIGEVNFLTGICFLYLGLYEKSIPYLSKSMELDPYYFWTPYKLAMCYMGTGEFEKAAFYFDKYFELAPVVLVFPGRPIALFLKMKEFKRVEDMLAQTEKDHPDYWGLPYCKALLFAAKGKKNEALELYQNSEVYSLLGMKDKAIEHLQKEIRGSEPVPYLFYWDLQNNPFYDNLRLDVRFQEILKKEKTIYDRFAQKYNDF